MCRYLRSADWCVRDFEKALIVEVDVVAAREALEEAATACGVDSMARAEDLSPESFYGMVGYLAGRLPA